MPLETIVVGDENLFDVIIIGAGPGGLIAGTELAKMNYLVAIIERDVPGGKIVKINNIRNFSESEGIVGSELATKYYNEYTKTNGRYIFGNIVNITKKLGYIAIYSSEGQT
jgi:thioredoxin reductase (NADPH)